MKPLEIGSTQRPARGETICGDSLLILPLEQGLLVALADGLGHGPEAAAASQRAIEAAQRNPMLDLELLLRECHHSQRGLRGSQMSLMRLWFESGSAEDTGQISFTGVGNVRLEAMSQHPIRPITAQGILGYHFGRIMVLCYELHPGDLLVLYSDGISSRFDLQLLRHRPAQEIADWILAECSTHDDDASVVAIRL